MGTVADCWPSPVLHATALRWETRSSTTFCTGTLQAFDGTYPLAGVWLTSDAGPQIVMDPPGIRRLLSSCGRRLTDLRMDLFPFYDGITILNGMKASLWDGV